MGGEESVFARPHYEKNKEEGEERESKMESRNEWHDSEKKSLAKERTSSKPKNRRRRDRTKRVQKDLGRTGDRKTM